MMVSITALRGSPANSSLIGFSVLALLMAHGYTGLVISCQFSLSFDSLETDSNHSAQKPGPCLGLTTVCVDRIILQGRKHSPV